MLQNQEVFDPNLNGNLEKKHQTQNITESYNGRCYRHRTHVILLYVCHDITRLYFLSSVC